MLLFTPQPQYYRTSSRDLYLQQLAEEAARERYLSQHYSHTPNLYSYEDLQQARARQYFERQEAIREAEIKRRALLERHRQQQLEEERSRQEQAYHAEMERRKYIDAIRRAYASQRHDWEPEQADDDDVEDENEESVEDVTRTTRSSSTPVRITLSSPKPEKAQPTLEQMNEAAVIIQSTFRTYSNRRKAKATLKAIHDSFSGFVQSFEFPIQLSFDSAPDSSSYKLSYDATNAPIHKFEDSLMRLLSKLDGVESNGDLVIREERRNLAREIEAELERLDQKKEDSWEKFRIDSQLPVVSSPIEMEAVLEEPTETVSDVDMGDDEVEDDRSTVVGDDDETPVDEEEFKEKKDLEMDTMMESAGFQESSSLNTDDNSDFAIITDQPTAHDSEDEDDSYLASLFSNPDRQTTSEMESEDAEAEDSDFVLVPSEPSPSADGSISSDSF